MTITLNLTPELEQRLTQEAERRGLPADELALQLLTASLPPDERRAKLVALLQSWIDEPDAKELQQAGDELVRTLDEDRLSDRKLFPLDLKGVTW